MASISAVDEPPSALAGGGVSLDASSLPFLSSAPASGFVAGAAWPRFCATAGALLTGSEGAAGAAGVGALLFSGTTSEAAAGSEPGSGTLLPPQPVNITQIAARPMPADHPIQGLIALHSFHARPPEHRSTLARPAALPSPDMTDAESSSLIMQPAAARWKRGRRFCTRSRSLITSINNRSHRYVIQPT